ncbi:MAG: hypothetical protein J6A45_03225 [Lachnospiraceae bacterium]|nr:hypothetical protein [Lachnospiraceae bacterium]
MTELLLIVVIGMLGYMIYYMKKLTGEDKTEKSKLSFEKILPDYLGKKCEIYVKDSMAAIDIMSSVTGVLIDMDDEWLVMEVENKKKKLQKVFRISNVKSFKEIV